LLLNKIFDVLVKEPVCIWKRYRKQAAVGMLKLISERTLDIDRELCACYIKWQKAFDHGNWTSLMQILKETAIGCHERTLISKLYMDHSVMCKQEQERLEEE